MVVGLRRFDSAVSAAAPRTNPSGLARRALHEVLDRVGLLCLSGNLTSELLWGHYADGHRGVCVEFDPHAGLFLAAEHVNYTNEPPVINRLVDGVDQILEKSMFTKGPPATWRRNAGRPASREKVRESGAASGSTESG